MRQREANRVDLILAKRDANKVGWVLAKLHILDNDFCV